MESSSLRPASEKLTRESYRLPTTDCTIFLVRDLQPLLHFRIDVPDVPDLDPMCDAVLLGEAARVDEPLGRFRVGERESQIDSGPRRGHDLREDMLAVERHDRLAGASLDVGAEGEAEIEERLVNRLVLNDRDARVDGVA